MDNDSDQAWHDHAPTSPLPTGRRRWPWFLLIMVLVLAGASASGLYAWPLVAPLLPTLGRGGSEADTAASDKDALPGLLATQQKLEEDLAAIGRSVADQQEQFKAIVDQLAGLTSKVEALQHSAPTPVPPPIAAEPSTAIARPALAATTQPARKPQRLPRGNVKPAGPVSTGGVPLTAAPGDAVH